VNLANENLPRIQKISRILRFATLLGAFTVPLIPPFTWAFYHKLPAVMKRKIFDGAPESLGFPSQILGIGFSIPSGVLLFLMLGSITKLLSLYGKGRLFELENAVWMRRSALFILLHTLYGMLIAQPLTSVALTLGNPLGQKAIAFALSSGDLTGIFCASFLYLTAWVSLEGHRIKAEGDLTI